MAVNGTASRHIQTELALSYGAMNEKASRHTKEQPKEKKIPKSSTKKRTSMFTAV